MQENWSDVTMQALVSVWESFLLYLPNLLMGLILLIFGWFVAIAFGKVVSQILKKARFDKFFEKEEWKEAMDKAQIKINPSHFIGSITQWIVYIFFIWAAVGVLGLVYFNEFMTDIIRYIPSVIVAALIFVIAIILADFLSKIVIVSAEKAKFKCAYFAGEIVKWSIWIFAGFAILIELGIARELLSTLFTGIIALMVIAGGIAFGLGGKETAAEILKGLKGSLKK